PAGQELLDGRESRAGAAAGNPRPAAPAPLRRIVRQRLGKRAAGAEEQRLDGGLRQHQLVRDLAVGESLPLTEQERAALLLGQHAEGARQAEELVRVAVVGRDDLLDQLEVARRLDEPPPVGVALLRQADVVRDLEEQRALEFGRRPALETAKRIHEGDLRRVLGLLAVAELVLAERENLALVLLVEQARRFAFRLVEPDWRRC